MTRKLKTKFSTFPYKWTLKGLENESDKNRYNNRNSLNGWMSQSLF